MEKDGLSEKKTQSPPDTSGGNGSVLGKIIPVLIIILVSLVAGYIVRMVTEGDPKMQEKAEPQTALPTAAIRISQPVATATAAIKESADIEISEPAAILSQTLGYKTQNNVYLLKAPAGWTLKQDFENNNITVTVTDGKNSLIIKALEATDGVPCGFPDVPLATSEMFPDVSQYSYQKYGEFTGHDETIFRRADITANPSAGKSFFVVCQRRENQFSQPTLFGFVTYEIPYSDNPEVKSAAALETLDQIFGSLKPQQ